MAAKTVATTAEIATGFAEIAKTMHSTKRDVLSRIVPNPAQKSLRAELQERYDVMVGDLAKFRDLLEEAAKVEAADAKAAGKPAKAASARRAPAARGRVAAAGRKTADKKEVSVPA
jgi:hypothetical protein